MITDSKRVKKYRKLRIKETSYLIYMFIKIR